MTSTPRPQANATAKPRAKPRSRSTSARAGRRPRGSAWTWVRRSLRTSSLPPYLTAARGRIVRWARTKDPIAIALIVVPLLAFVIMAWQWRWTHDDGFITLRVVDQVFAGHGPVYNTGQRVEVFTSPLHLGLLILLRALFGWVLNEAWLGVILTIGSMVIGFVAAVEGAARLARAGGAEGRFLPLGVLVPVALPPMWEYATSGLETGIAIGWIGLSFWLLAGVVTRPRARSKAQAKAKAVVAPSSESTTAAVDAATDPTPAEVTARPLWVVAMVVGLGPLVRPECTLFTVAFVGVLVASSASGPSRVARLRVLAAALALPIAYEIFRMGYYGALVPNTALAKEAGGSQWSRGWNYLVNFVGPYGLLVPLLVFGLWIGFGRRGSLRRTFGGREGRNLVGALVGAAVFYGLYVVKVGGDYMHARMLLPPMFALCCPLAVVAVPTATQVKRVVFACVGTLVVWSLVVGFTRRAPKPPPGAFFTGRAVAEQRAFWRTYAANPHPVTLDEWRRSAPYSLGSKAKDAYERGHDVLFTSVVDPRISLPFRTPLAPGRGAVLFTDGIGVAGSRAGVNVQVIDFHGLADPIASRMPTEIPLPLPGHEKDLPQSWALAEASITEGDSSVVDAAAALRCGEIHTLLEAIAAPMSPSRFFQNLLEAPHLTTFRIPKAPSDSAVNCARVDG